MDKSGCDERWMQRSLELAKTGQGRVEPNPMVGCIIVNIDGSGVSEGCHSSFGGPHAEIEAIKNATFDLAGATMYVSLEPCCHHGKTPPCTDALIESRIGRVVVGCRDPFPEVAGNGVEALERAGIEVDVGILESDALQLIAPFRKRISTKLPWVIAKWAMTLDGKIATTSGDSQWISNEQSRAITHQLRGRVDAVLVGSGTVAADDPLLTARPPGARVATRVVVDSNLGIDLDSQLVKTAVEFPLIIASGPDADPLRRDALENSGVEVIVDDEPDRNSRLQNLLVTLAERGMTNVLVEGGGAIFGSLFQLNLVDEVHVFVAPKLVGGESAASPIAGPGIESMEKAIEIESMVTEQVGNDLYLHGCIAKN